MNPVANILRSECPELKIFNDVSFRELTSLGVGNGLLPLLVEPESEEQLVDVLKILHKKEIRTCEMWQKQSHSRHYLRKRRKRQ